MSAALDRDRLARILGMLGSNHPGEALNAARAAEQMRRESGLTWPQILAVRALPATTPLREPVDRDDHQRDDRGDQNLAAMIELCRKNPQHLSEWERRFVGSLAGEPRLSKKQMAVLRQIVASVRQGRRSRHKRRAAA